MGPDLFLPFAEESGLVSELGRVVLEKASMDAVRWQKHNVVVAEGVESTEHADELRGLGADLGQGFFFSRPVSGEGIDEFLSAELASGARSAV